MNLQVRFGKPRDVSPNDLNGVVIRYPFAIRKVGQGALRDTVTEHMVDVKISGTLFIQWRFGSLNRPIDHLQNLPFLKTLFEFARNEVESNLRAETLKKDIKITLHTGNMPAANPYDPEKIPNPDGFSFQLELLEKVDVKNSSLPSDVPKVFISYSWDNDPHKAWVREFSTRLRTDGVDVTLDQWHLAPGDQLPEFMERAVRENNFMLIICTPHYKEKSDARQGGVGYEGDIMTAEVFSKGNHRKFIPILRDGAWEYASPVWLFGKYRIDLRGKSYSEEQYKDLLVTIHNQRPQAPPLGNPTAKPNLSVQVVQPPISTPKPDDPIKIEGIVADEVSTPTLDGTRGSALYSIPFRLSRVPSADWTEVFISTWDHPPHYTSMHRPGIARVVGNKIILTRTTIEEVEKYHRATLLLAVEAANKAEAAIRAERQRKRNEEEERKRKHQEKIQDVAKKLRFD